MGAKNYRLLIVLCLIAFIFNGCKSDEEVLPDVFSGSQVLVANQGNFGWGEGTLSVYYEGSKTIENEVYSSVNKTTLGNVFQSISSINDSYYFVINNSGKVVVTDTNFNETQTIEGFVSPRYVYNIDGSKAYVTDLYANKISILDLKSNRVINEIVTGQWAEKAVLLDGMFWYTAPNSNKVYGIDTDTDQLKDSIAVGEKPESIIRDKNGVIWVLCKGDESKNESAKLTSVRIEDGDITVISSDIKGVPTSLAYDEENNSIYFLSDKVWVLRINEGSQPETWLEIPNAAFYTVAVNPASGDVYVSDVKDFVSKSTIYRYSREGALLDEFSAGIIAGDFFFP
jgi:YVTN family beta-propeller protein